MGTRGTIHIQDDGKTIVSVYRQMDSYPTGLGQEIFELCFMSEIKNGYSLGDQCPEKFNGMGCLGAYLIGHLKLVPYGKIKNAIGNVYITNSDDRQEYNYFISHKRTAKKTGLYLIITNSDDKPIFSDFLNNFKAKELEK